MTEIAEHDVKEEEIREHDAKKEGLKIDHKEKQEVPSVVNKGPMAFVGGEIRIIANPQDGSIRVSSPPNLLIALGMLETAKFILVQQQQKQMEDALNPKIKPATVADIAALDKKLQN